MNDKNQLELQEMQMKMNQNKTIQDFVKAQNELVELLKGTNNIISAQIRMQFAFSSGGGYCG